jgi:hypothetical protein
LIRVNLARPVGATLRLQQRRCAEATMPRCD